MSALKITLEVSDTPAAVLKNRGFLIYDKHLNLWKRDTATCSSHSDVPPSQKGAHTQTLIYTALSYATNINEVQPKEFHQGIHAFKYLHIYMSFNALTFKQFAHTISAI